MSQKPFLSPRRALLTFLVAMVGAVAGILAGPRIVAAAEGAPPWLLPAVVAVSVLLALVAAYVGARVTRSNAIPGAAGARDGG